MADIIQTYITRIFLDSEVVICIKIRIFVEC